MKPNKKFAPILAVVFVFCAIAIPAHSQTTTPSKPIKARFEVLKMLYNSIQVRSVVNEREIHTFTYSNGILVKMQSLFNNGGYQYGDKVVIWYQPGAEVALKIKGKPSKPIVGSL
jgi:hypothetical protein